MGIKKVFGKKGNWKNRKNTSDDKLNKIKNYCYCYYYNYNYFYLLKSILPGRSFK